MYTALTIAGSDSGGGAGIQADLKTFAALGVYGTSAITAITAQNTQAVTRVQELEPAIVAAQIEAVLTDIGANAVKTGMLGSADLVETVCAQLVKHRVAKVVVDPVMMATEGTALLDADGIDFMREELFPLALVVTPNVPEAAVLTGKTLATMDDLRQAARIIHEFGPKNVVIKGGHWDGNEAIDLFYDGDHFAELLAPRIATPHTHGTGCTFSAAIAGNLALGNSVPEAIRNAKAYVTMAMEAPLSIGHGRRPLNHFFFLK